MSKKQLNQNSKYTQELINTFEPDFSFNEEPVNRINMVIKNDSQNSLNKAEKLIDLKSKINSIENCTFKKNSKNIILGNGNVNSPIMLVGDAPGYEEDLSGLAYQGDVGELMKKMLIAININIENVYLSYSINCLVSQERKPSSQEIKRYSVFLKEHISIINPEIIILMGSVAMESLMGISKKISGERGNWKEIIVKGKTYPIMITFSPSYLLRFPENKKYSWEDLKKIRQKIQELNIKI